jgi:hypothetical protein
VRLEQQRGFVSGLYILGGSQSGLFWVFARHARDRGLARASAVAIVVFYAAAFYFGSRL